VIADGPAAEVLTGGAYFVTETARILGGAAAALTPEQGIAVLTGAGPGDPPATTAVPATTHPAVIR
jgi:hypothetical protein